MRTSELEYDFDPSLVATEPAHPRDAARLMVVDRKSGSLTHTTVRALPQFLRHGDALAVNRTSVLRARILVRDRASGRTSEGLLLEPCAAPSHWRMLLRHAKRFEARSVLSMIHHAGHETDDTLELIERDGEAWIVRVHAGAKGGDIAEILERSGHTPLPPYILKARRDAGLTLDDDDDRAEYETVYADHAARGSVAAPTAGLHFTTELLDKIAAQGVPTHELILHVGAGTFKPVEVDDLRDHPMHTESFSVPAPTLRALRMMHASRLHGSSRLIAVGTTTVRALESLPKPLPDGDAAHAGLTNILIAPGHRFQHVDALLTNFHLPRSTLLALVGAFLDSHGNGMELLRHAYSTAVRERYRFYSYGDAMLVV
ncbi:MAG: tRNA preQ1(34) S-adenosylmethionine ribosyltransferase-isomerase QueA [Limnohabitans sp.]|nr:tRNA preQ1(34) S-adenosylmethionine ribosyltransferase-isomerase QueA [Limnohabitans sp.]